MRNDPLEQWYKKEASQQVTQPSDAIWGNIAAALDSNSDAEKASAVRRISIWSLFLFFVVSFGTLFFVNDNQNDASRLAVYQPQLEKGSKDSFLEEERRIATADPLEINPSENTSIEGNRATSTPVLAATNLNSNHNSNPTATANDITLDAMPINKGFENNARQYKIVEALSSLPISSFAFESNTPETLTKVLNPIPKEKEHKFPQGTYVGLQSSIDNIWALNHDTYNGFDSHSFVLNKAKFGVGLTVVGGINLNEQHALQIELQAHKAQGQTFGYYEEGRYYENNLRLNYSRVNALYKFRKVAQGRQQYAHATNLIVGPYAGYLRSAKRIHLDHKENLSNNYNKADFGVILGLEHERMIGAKWSLAAGLRTSVGINNIFKGDGIVPKHFNTTRNLSFGGTFGLRYHLSK